MTETVQEYLQALKGALEGSDGATVQDALADAEEHLRTALASLRESQPELDEADALEQVIAQYGTPEETAAAYMEVERRTFPGLAPAPVKKPASPFKRFFGVYTDPRAWGGLFYMLIAFVTGVVYFTWAVTGLSLSVSFALFIFGLPVALLFLLSVRGVAWLEGRLVEALLGVRMPRRPLAPPRNAKWLERVKVLALDRRTWLSLLYMLLQFVLGTFYFVLLVTVLALFLTCFAIPVAQLAFELPVITVNSTRYYLPLFTLPLFPLVGLLLWTEMMHLARWIGGLHGRYAKALLVSE